MRDAAPTARPSAPAGRAAASCDHVGEVEQAVDRVDLVVGRRRARCASRSSIAARHRARDLEPHDVAEAAPAQLELDRLEQVVGLVRDLEVGVARDAEQRRARRSPSPGRAAAGSARSRPRAAGAGRARRPATKRGRPSGTLTRAKRSSPVSGSRTNDAEAEREPRDVRERLAGPDRERRQHREDLALEPRRRARRSSSSVAVRRPRRSTIPSAASAGRELVASRAATARPSARAPARGSRRAPARGVRPSGERTASPARPGPIRPATRTMKNSSRFDEKIAQNFTRSSSGSSRSAASSSTRALKSSHESSRLRSALGGRCGLRDGHQ